MPSRRETTSLPKPSHDPQPPSANALFRTQNTNLGSYLIAAEKLRFKAAELLPDTSVVDLVFFDPEGIGPDLVRRFTVGAVDSVNARVLFEVRGYLLSEVKRAQAGVDRGPR